MGIFKKMNTFPKLNVSTRRSSTSFVLKGEASFNIFILINVYYKTIKWKRSFIILSVLNLTFKKEGYIWNNTAK
jgi:hypothetical protein